MPQWRLQHAIRMALCLMTVMLTAVGCTHKQLLFPDEEPSHWPVVRFVWTDAPEARPAGMTVYFFPREARALLWRFDISGRDGGPVGLPPGEYAMAAVNNDLPGIYCPPPQSFYGFRAESIGSSSPEVCLCTGMVYSGYLSEVDVSTGGEVHYTLPDGSVRSSASGVMECFPDSVTTIYHVRIGSIDHPERIRAASARLGGVAAGVDLVTGLRSAKSTAIGFDLDCSGISGRSGPAIIGEGSGFGTPDVADPHFTLELILTDFAGGTAQASFDVTQQVLSSPWRHNVYIRIAELNVPDIFGDPDVGIKVGVGGWEEVETTLVPRFPGGL